MPNLNWPRGLAAPHYIKVINMARKLEDEDLGYLMYCAANMVRKDPIGWLHEQGKQRYITMAKDFIELADLTPREDD